jgi:hypothetical protein
MGTAALALFLISAVASAQGPPPEAPAIPIPGAPPSAKEPPPVTLGPLGAGPIVPAPLPGAPSAPKQGPPRKISIHSRSSVRGDLQTYKENGETIAVYTGGIILTITNPGDKMGLLDIEGDRLVIWTKGDLQAAERMATPQGETTGTMEFYMAGHVELRFLGPKGQTEMLQADEVYYDTRRNVAIALQGDLEIRDPKVPYPIHMKAPELFQLNAKTFETGPSEVYSTLLPSDPGLKIELRKNTLVERETVRQTIFGQPYRDPKTGEPLVERERYFTGRDMVVRLEGVPIFYFPYLAGNIEDPLGPLDAISFNYNRIFGFQIYTTWDIFDLIGMHRPEGMRWRLLVDYLTARGPALGTQFDYSSFNLFGLPGRFESLTKAWGIQDSGQDVIGSGGQFAYQSLGQPIPIFHSQWRGRFLERMQAQDLPDGFVFQGQLSLISDRNFMEQYYLNEFLNDLNQETYAYLKQQKENWAWTLLVEPWWRDWVTETEWLPRGDAYLLGQTIFDRFVYNAHVSAGYAQLRPTGQPPPAYQPTEVRLDTARLDLWQELSLPFTLGPFKVVPYVVGDLTGYSRDINADDVGRAYGGGGVRASIPFSKLYPDICSDLFNLNGIYHKIVLSGNYFNAGSTTPHNRLPQLDLLEDDVSDFTLRNMHILQPVFNPSHALLLTTSPMFDPQTYAIRRLLETRIDTLDSIEVLQMDLRQRWQTKRGFPGNEHIVDWMTFDVQASLFPDTHRDNFGHYFGIVEWDWNWNIGDRTALFSSGWFEPFTTGPHSFNLGATFSRPDSTSFTVSYRQIDPLNSRAVIGSITYPFSAKYALTASTTWDFGVRIQTYSLLFSRLGTDVQINLGVSYNSILNTFGVTFELVPNLLRGSLRPGTGTPLLGGPIGAAGSGR